MLAQVFDSSNYTFSIYALPTLLTMVSILALGVAVLIRERVSSVSFSFFLLTLFVSIWLFAFSCAYATTSEAVALWWSKAAYLGVPFIAPATYQFAASVLRLPSKKLTWFSWLGAGFFSAAALWTSALVGSVHRFSWGYYTQFNWLGSFFLLFFGGILVASMCNYWTELRKASLITSHKLRIRSLMIAFAIGYVGSIDYVAAYGIPLYPMGYVAILGFIVVAARAIWIYQLVDITPAFAATQIIENMTDALLVLDREGVIRLANRAAGRLYGYTQEELTGKRIGSAIEDKFFTTQLARCVEHGNVHNRELVYRPRQGEMRFLSLSTSTMGDERGWQAAILCMARDITETKRAEEAILESEERYRSVVEQASEGIYLADIDTRRFVEANAAFLDMLGYSIDEIRRLTVYDIVPHDRESVDRYFERLLNERRYVVGERQYRRKDGTLVDVEVSINLISHGGKEMLCAVAHDVTERRKAQERVQKQLDRVAALRDIDVAITTGHDLRVTLGIILEHVTGQLHVDAADILMLNPHTQALEYTAGRGFRHQGITCSKVRPGEGYAGRAAFALRPIYVPDLSETADRSTLLEGEDMVAYYALPLTAKGQVKGVLEIFNRSPLDLNADWADFAEALAGQAAIAIENASLFDDLQRSHMELIMAYDTTLEGWSQALDLRDRETEGHTQRVTAITERLAREMGLSEAEMVHVRRGALLHDIGKMGIPDSILLKPGPLTPEEWEIMRMHPVYAYELLSPIAFLRPALDIPYCHHEKWDGTGYPRGLKGAQIPVAARIFSVVDVWDALRSDRPYRKSWSEGRVREHIRSLAGTHFDPQVVEVFLKTWEWSSPRRLTTLELTMSLIASSPGVGKLSSIEP